MITTILTNAIVTAYIATGNPCADGHYPTVGTTIALPRIYPLGSKVIIGSHVYIGQDRLNKRWPSNRFDLFFPDLKSAKAWGIHKNMRVTIITEK